MLDVHPRLKGHPMTKLAFLPLLLLAAQPALGVEAWDCQMPGHGGVWQIDGNELVAPGAGTRFPIVRNTPDAVVALTEGGRRFELAILDRRRLTIKILLFGLDANTEQREVGTCAVPDTHAVAAARTALGNVRPRIRDLVKQAQGLADRGFTTAAGLKLTEAQGFERVTPDEAQLIGQMRQYVAAKPRR
jgi:hypothetical protein